MTATHPAETVWIYDTEHGLGIKLLEQRIAAVTRILDSLGLVDGI